MFDKVKEPDVTFLNRVRRYVEDFGVYIESVYGGTVPSRQPSGAVWIPHLRV